MTLTTFFSPPTQRIAGLEEDDLTALLRAMPDDLLAPAPSKPATTQQHRQCLSIERHVLQLWGKPIDAPSLLLWLANESAEAMPLRPGLTVGRGEVADWSLPQVSGLSSLHFRVERRDEDWWLVDLGSTNGLKINENQETTPEHRLISGDYFLAGRGRFVFVDFSSDEEL